MNGFNDLKYSGNLPPITLVTLVIEGLLSKTLVILVMEGSPWMTLVTLEREGSTSMILFILVMEGSPWMTLVIFFSPSMTTFVIVGSVSSTLVTLVMVGSPMCLVTVINLGSTSMILVTLVSSGTRKRKNNMSITWVAMKKHKRSAFGFCIFYKFSVKFVQSLRGICFRYRFAFIASSTECHTGHCKSTSSPMFQSLSWNSIISAFLLIDSDLTMSAEHSLTELIFSTKIKVYLLSLASGNPKTARLTFTWAPTSLGPSHWGY